MEIQLRELIDQIKKEGVEAAEQQAETILSRAKSEADKIIADAKAEADKIIADARIENDRMVKSGEDAVRQAGRNLLISFRESVVREVNSILKENVASVYSSEAMADIIIKVVQSWADGQDADDISVVLNSEDLKSLEETVVSALRDRVKKGVTLKASDSIDKGFRISADGGNAYYDYSAQSVVEMLSKYLSPAIVKLLKEAE